VVTVVLLAIVVTVLLLAIVVTVLLLAIVVTVLLLLAIVVTVLRFTDSDYPFCIFKCPLLRREFYLNLNTPNYFDLQ
jgi:hypothetical protein